MLELGGLHGVKGLASLGAPSWVPLPVLRDRIKIRECSWCCLSWVYPWVDSVYMLMRLRRLGEFHISCVGPRRLLEERSRLSSYKFFVSGSLVLGVWMLLEEFCSTCLLNSGHYFYKPHTSGKLSVVCFWFAEWRSVLSRRLSCLALVSEMYAEWRSVLIRRFSCTISSC